MKATRALALASVLPLSFAWNVIYYADDKCGGDVITFENKTSEDGTCHQPITMEIQPRSALITNMHRNRFSQDLIRLVRFYDTDDCITTCSHRHIIGHTDWDECVSWPLAVKDGRQMQSFKIEKIGNIGMGRDGAISDGICRLEHGDTLFFRNRSWRMQQVAAAWFKEIPEEEWDSSVHERNTTVRFGRHGDVDMFGQYKLRQRWSDWIDEVILEYWDEEKHIKEQQEDYYDPSSPKFYDNMVADLCFEATRVDINQEYLTSKIPNVAEICKDWKEDVHEEDVASSVSSEDQATFSSHAEVVELK